jgi:segregation and condensation protein A
MPETNFEIHLPQFDGPFDLLLFFIERDELEIHAIPIAKITNDFLDYINQLTALNVEVAADFILVAATLMRIKAKTLLPIQHLAEGEENTITEEELINRLIAYKQTKQQAQSLKQFEENRSQQVKRGNIAHDISLAATTAGNCSEEVLSFDIYKLLKIYKNLLSKYNQQIVEHKHVVQQYEFTIAQQKEIIQQLMAINQKLSYQQIKNSTKTKVELVYSFLAVLEMVQESLVAIEIGLGFNNFYIRPIVALPQ